MRLLWLHKQSFFLNRSVLLHQAFTERPVSLTLELCIDERYE